MNINSVNSKLSFKAIIIDNYGKKPTKLQKQTIKRILNHPDLNKKLVKDLEKINTDIYIETRPYSNEVALKLYTDLNWFGKKFIPYDGRYNTKMETFINKEFQRDFIINLKLSNFLKRAKEIDLESDKNIKAANIMMGVKNI